jgi:hypothetical protein
MPTLKRHECRAPVAFHAFLNTGWGKDAKIVFALWAIRA